MSSEQNREWNADAYENNSHPQHASALQALKLLNLKGDEKILDIGCGDGKITAQLAHMVPKGSVLGIDASAEMINFAIAAHKDIANLRFEHMNANEVNFDQEFDVVVSFACFHFVKDKKDAFERIYKSLKPNGQLLILMNDGYNFKLVHIAQELQGDPQWQSYFPKEGIPVHFNTNQELTQILNACAFNNGSVKNVANNYKLASEKDLHGWLNALSFWDHLSEKESHDMINEMVRRYIKQTTADGKNIVFTIPWFLITAEK